MARPSSLLKVDRLTEAVGFYSASMVVQKALGLGRVVLLAYLLADWTDQFGLWVVSVMTVMLAGALVGLGVNHSLIRYVSLYESASMGTRFFRYVRWRVGAVALIGSGAAILLGGRAITAVVFASRGEAANVSAAEQYAVCCLALANGGLLSMYSAMIGFMTGLRTYRLAAAAEVAFAAIFTLVGCVAVAYSRSAVTLLVAHLASVAVVVAAGTILLGRAVSAADKRADPSQRPAAEVADLSGAFGRLMRYGLVAMIGALLWLAVQYLGLYLTNRLYGKASAATYGLMLRLGQPVVFVASAIWTVVLTHVASRWESHRRDEAVSLLSMAYRAISLAGMTVTVLVLLTSPLWIRLLPMIYRDGLTILAPMLLLFQVIAQVSVLGVLGKLHERPIVGAAAAALGGGIGLVLVWLMPTKAGAMGIAMSCGLGLYLGSSAAAACYFLATRTPMGRGGYLALVWPVLLLTPPWIIAVVWGVVLAASLATPLIASRDEKRLIVEHLAALGRPKGAGGP